jgi:peptidoglycan/LPS O-acetylase OafA/YrhL
MEKHIKELDGLRGVAVLLVVALHTFKRAAYFTKNPFLLFLTELTSVGWVGVDIFFALSGFLITSILLRARDKKDYFKNFYIRRVLRIFPLYYLGIAVVLLFAPKIEKDFVAHLSTILPMMLIYQQNWLLIFSDLKITLYLWITWSLAVEEQFYLLWPLAVYFLKKENLLKVSLGIVVLSILLRVVGALIWKDVSEYSLFFYYNSFTRFEEIIIGALLAVLFSYQGLRERIRKFSLPVFYASFLVFLLLCIGSLPNVPNPLYGNVTFTVFGYTAAALFSTALIAVFITYPENAFLRVLFRNRVLVFFGKYSYSIYLFHMTVAIIVLEYLWHTGLRGWWMYIFYAGIVLGIATLVAFLTWHLLEKHFLNLKKYFEVN